MTHTDTQLKAALAKMLPEQITVKTFHDEDKPYSYLYWLRGATGTQVLDTELLDLCWRVEETLTVVEASTHYDLLGNVEPDNAAAGAFAYHCTWQQRVIALAKVKGIEL